MLEGWWRPLQDAGLAWLLSRFVLQSAARTPIAGQTAENFPALFGGQLNAFFSPQPPLADWTANLQPVRQSAAGVSLDAWFPSSITTEEPENNRVWLRHFPAAQPTGDVIVGVDGLLQAGTRWFRQLAALLCPLGVDVICLDAPLTFRRTPVGFRPGELVVGGDLDHQLSVARQGVLDLWSLVRALQLQSRRVGLVGLSHGGWLVAQGATVIPGLDLLISVAPPVDVLALMNSGSPFATVVSQGLERSPHLLVDLETRTRPVRPRCWKPLLDSSRITLIAGKYDRFVPVEPIRELANRWSAQQIEFDWGHYHLTATPALHPTVVNIVQRQWGVDANGERDLSPKEITAQAVSLPARIPEKWNPSAGERSRGDRANLTSSEEESIYADDRSIVTDQTSSDTAYFEEDICHGSAATDSGRP